MTLKSTSMLPYPQKIRNKTSCFMCLSIVCFFLHLPCSSAISLYPDTFEKNSNFSFEHNSFYVPFFGVKNNLKDPKEGYSLINSSSLNSSYLQVSDNIFLSLSKITQSSANADEKKLNNELFVHQIAGTNSKFYATMGDDNAFFDKTKMHVREIGKMPYTEDSYKGFGEIGLILNPYGNSELKLNFGIKKIYENNNIRGTWLSIESNYNF